MMLAETLNEISELRLRCKSNFNGYWELDHSSYVGDLDDLEYIRVRRWSMIINSINNSISENKK